MSLFGQGRLVLAGTPDLVLVGHQSLDSIDVQDRGNGALVEEDLFPVDKQKVSIF